MTVTAEHSCDRRRLLGVFAGFGAGLVGSLQTFVNGRLGTTLDNGILAATISFASGAAILTLLLLLFPKGREGIGRVWASLRAGRKRATAAELAAHPSVPDIGRLRWFQVMGGAAGGFFVAAQGITVGSIGVALFVVSVTAGQSLSSLCCDLLGLAPGGRHPLTIGRALGPLLAIAAVFVARWGTFGDADQWYLLALPMIAGVVVAMQHAVNGRVVATAAADVTKAGKVERSTGTFTATFINFVVGTVTLLVVLVIALIIQGLPDGGFPSTWWLYTGGVLGVIFIGTAAAVVHRIGVLLLALSLIAGQVTGGLLLDLAQGADLATRMFIAVALTFCAVAAPKLVGRRKDDG
ncbi:MAG: DMT family transporter [Promicromonosporaceae bacterium]|nr:DMT family transporter [Promicromonosporaceae bacterium]